MTTFFWRILSLFCLICLIIGKALAQGKMLTLFETSQGTETVTYAQGMQFVEQLAQCYPNLMQLKAWGSTDAGIPLHTIVATTDQDFTPESAKKKGKVVILVNNAIHPGEPDGVDATLLLLRNIATQTALRSLLQKVVLVAIPFYNIGGTLNRGSFSRANQNGPVAYGFRGNGKNLDLNRDFIKLDSENAHTFTQIFQHWQPDILVDNHVSNGADYQHIFTCLVTQENKLGNILGNFLRTDMYPALAQGMQKKQIDMIPYVNAWETPPDSGWVQFLDSPRYSSGYAALFQTLAFVPETHMLKPYKQRVEATYQFMLNLIEYAQENSQKILNIRQKALQSICTQSSFSLQWQVDKSTHTWIDFKGYRAKYVQSKVTQLPQLVYDQSQPFTKKVKFFDSYYPSVVVTKPWAYLIPKAYKAIVERLRLNKVRLEMLTKNQTIESTAYYIHQYNTLKQPFEGHYLHYGTQVLPQVQSIEAQAGDFLVILNQEANRYIVETLEPQATDSFFNWNFFDAILQQKEGFSSYVFEPIAEKLLAQNPELQKKLDEKRQADKKFAQDAEAQLNFIYQNSPYYEKTHLRYPILRIERALTTW